MGVQPFYHVPGKENMMALCLQPFIPAALPTAPRSATLDATPDGGELKFLIVDGWDENITHIWEKFDSITSNILKNVISVGKNISELNGYRPGRNSSAYAAKVDEALVYQDSPRRSFTFKLNLAAKNDAYEEVYMPVKKLQWYSCAGIDGDSMVSVNWPHLFNVSVREWDGGLMLLEMSLAALQNCDVTWKMPYIKTSRLAPCVADLSLTFIELAPLYKQTLEEQGPWK